MEGEANIIGRADCGPACLQRVLEHFGQYIALDDLRTECGTTATGTTAAQLKAAAEGRGLEVAAYLRTFQLLESTPLPCILHWDQGRHFVVLERLDMQKQTAEVFDPAAPRNRQLHTLQLQHYYSGVVMELSE